MMKWSTEEQSARILKEAEDGIAATDVCRKQNLSEQTIYRKHIPLLDDFPSDIEHLCVDRFGSLSVGFYTPERMVG